MRFAITALAALVLLLAACGGEENDPAPAAPAATGTPAAPAPTATPGTDASDGQPSAANAFIGSIVVDPQDGTMYLGTGLGLFRVGRGGGEAERVVGHMQTPDGQGTVSSNLVVRPEASGKLLASGHPEDGTLPENLGLIRSVDGGRTFEKRTPPAPPVDLAADGERIVVTTEQGSFTSGNEGRSWRPRDATPGGVLAWAAPDRLYRADRRGEVAVSSDGGSRWEKRGSLGAGPNELAAGKDGTLYAAVPGGEVKASRDGGATWKRYVKLR